jgi:hypothetical protein
MESVTQTSGYITFHEETNCSGQLILSAYPPCARGGSIWLFYTVINVFYVIFSSFIIRQCCDLYDQSSCEFRGMLLKLRNFQTPSTINL